MLEAITQGSLFCAVLTALSGALLLWRPEVGRARALWVVIALAGLAHALAVNLQPANLLSSNLVHYYLGAKYPIPQAKFYVAFQAAQEQPLIGIRDLDHPDRLLRSEPSSQRAYYIDMLRAAGAEFDALAPLDSLAAWARRTGALARESDRFLRQFLSPPQIADYREDVRVAVDVTRGRPVTDDFGFNGSPFYTLLRQLDPTLYFRFGPLVGWVNLVWQILAAILLAWIAGAAIGLDLDRRLVVLALLLASYDFTAYAMSGLVFGELWLPVAVAVLAMRRRRAGVAGVAVAWAGLVKLFPFVLALPAIAGLAHARNQPRRIAGGNAWGWWLRFIAACLLATIALGALSLFMGRPWGEFLHKIGSQFEGASLSINSVSLSAALQALRIHHSPVSGLLALIAMGFLAVMFLGDRDEAFVDALPRRALVLLTAMAWVTHTWLSYYALLPCVLVPCYVREHRVATSTAVFGMAASAWLANDAATLLMNSPWLRLLYILPYLLVPAWMVALELRPMMRSVAVRRLSLLAIGVAVLGTSVELWRVPTVDRLDAEAHARLEAGDATGALERCDRLLALSPTNPSGLMNRAIALATLGRTPAAHAAFERAAKLARNSAPAQDNFGRFLMAEGKGEEALRQLERARVLAPDDPEILTVLARIHLEQGDRPQAIRMFTRAWELDPENTALAAVVSELLQGAKPAR